MNNHPLDIEEIGLIANLRQLKKLTAPTKLRITITNLLVPTLPQRNLPHPSFFLSSRLVATLVLFIILTGSGLVVAAEKSPPGGLLYPLKQAVTGIKTKISLPPTSPHTSPSPAQIQVVTATASPTPPPKDQPEAIKGVVVVETKVSSYPAPLILTTSPTPTITAVVKSSSPTSVKVNLPGAPVNIKLNGSSSTPSPDPSPSPLLYLLLQNVNPTQSGSEVTVGEKDKPLLQIGL